MKKVEGEVLLATVIASRKTRGQTRFELGIGYVVDESDRPTGGIRLRTEQIGSGVAPVVGTLQLEDAVEFSKGLQQAIRMARGGKSSSLFSDE